MAFSLNIDGREVQAAEAFHDAVMQASDIGWYGQTLDALWDLLTGLVDAPISIRWTSAAASKASMGEDFTAIVSVIRDAEERYRSEWPAESFVFEMVE